jgi:uncharacterized protein
MIPLGSPQESDFTKAGSNVVLGMESIMQKLESADWDSITASMNLKGYAVIPDFLSADLCRQLKTRYHNKDGYRKTVTMERYRFGRGEYKYFDYPLPEVIQLIRTLIYPRLVTIANGWMKALGTDVTFPSTLKDLLDRCSDHHQTKPTPLILKYGQGGFNTMHQDLYGEVYFPLQTVLFLSESGRDYTGGEFVMTEQTPRAQSKAIVINPTKGSMLIFTTNFRPVKGTKGYYRISMRHGVSEIHTGERYTLGIIFHDALS